MIRALQWLVDVLFQGFFPDARTALQRREIVLSFLVVAVMALMWAGAAQSGRLTDAPPFSWK